MTFPSDLFAVIAPVFLLAALGFAWAKSGRWFDKAQLAPVISHIGTPALVLSSFLNARPDLENLGGMMAAALGVQLGCAAAAFLLLRLMGLPIRVYLPSMIYPNNGNMGLPLCLFAFGEAGLALGIAYFVVMPLSLFTVGQMISSGTVSMMRFVKTPVVWAVLLAVTLLALDVALPRWVGNTVTLAGQFTIPMMLLALGVSLSRLKAASLGRSLLLSALRVFGGLAFGWLVAWALELEGMAKGVVILQASMPVAVYNYLFAQLHDSGPEEVAGLVVASTALSFLALPFILGWVM